MITVTDLTTRFGEDEIAQISDKEHYRTINIDAVNKAIFDAETEAESYLNAVGLVSRNGDGELVYRGQAPQPLIIKMCDIARYYLYDDAVTSLVEKRYERALKWFERVQNNPKMLTGLSENETALTQSSIVVMPNPNPNQWDE